MVAACSAARSEVNSEARIDARTGASSESSSDSDIEDYAPEQRRLVAFQEPYCCGSKIGLPYAWKLGDSQIETNCKPADGRYYREQSQKKYAVDSGNLQRS